MEEGITVSMKIAVPFRHHATHICDEARKMLTDAGFELVCNDTGRVLTFDEQKEMIRGAFAVIAGTEPYDAAMLEGCDELKVIMRFGVGCDNFDLQTMKAMGIQVGVIANYNAVAEFAVMLILSAMKNLPQLDQAVRAGKWSRFPMRELTGKTVGLVGFGRIGRRVAEMLSGFDVKLLAYDPFMNEEEARKRNVVPASFDEVLGASDVVSLHLPANESTYHIINAETIAKMKDQSYLINTSRGKLVDEKALYAALQNGKLRAAGLDVYEQEPVKSADNPLFALENISLTPHTAAITYETNYNGGLICARSILNVMNGEAPVYPYR